MLTTLSPSRRRPCPACIFELPLRPLIPLLISGSGQAADVCKRPEDKKVVEEAAEAYMLAESKEKEKDRKDAQGGGVQSVAAQGGGGVFASAPRSSTSQPAKKMTIKLRK
jgi:hypothetical protein